MGFSIVRRRPANAQSAERFTFLIEVKNAVEAEQKPRKMGKFLASAKLLRAHHTTTGFNRWVETKSLTIV